MIKTNKKTTTVEFAKTKQGTIAIGTGPGFDNYQVTLQQTHGKTKVGETIEDPADVQELPKIILDFHQVESVRALIRALHIIEEKFNAPNYALAC